MKNIIKKTPFFAFVISFLIVAILLVSLSYNLIMLKKVDSLNTEEIYSNNEQIAISATSSFDLYLDNQISTIIGVEVSHHNVIGVGDVFDDSYYESILAQNEYISSLEIISINGDIIYSSVKDNNRVGINVSSYPIVETATELHTVYFGGLVYNSASESLTLEVLFTGENIFVLATISTDYFDLYYSEFEDSFNDKNILILNENGILIYDSLKQNHIIQYHFTDLQKLINLSENNITFESEIYDEESTVSVIEFEHNNWYMVLYEHNETAFELSETNIRYTTILFSILTLIFASVFVLIGYLMIREMKKLGQNLETAGTGNFDAVKERTTFKEIVHVQRQFNEMIIDLDKLTNQLSYAAYHDLLTGLPTKNKAKLDFAKWTTSTKSITFLYIDISRFSMINDNYGFDIGDYCLKEVSDILVGQFKHVYRVEGDEFICLLRDINDDALKEKLEQVHKKLTRGIAINDYQYSIPVNIGVSVYPDNGVEFLELMKKSLIAMSESRNNNDIYSVKFKNELSESYLRNSKIELLMRKAFKDSEFYTVYQPVVSIKDRKIRGFEALTRWENKELGVVNPDEFIPIMERTGLINQLDEFVLNNAMKLNKYLCDFYKTKFIMSVNLSVSTIMSDRFITIIDEAIERFGYDPSLLELEITESTIISDFDSITEKMTYLKQRGVKFSEDDFGDGFSSLTYLSRLRLDTLKISKNFLSSILTNVESRVLVQTILELSKRLGFFTIVEGVEDEETLELFKSYGCDYVQGFLLYKPMKIDLLLSLIKKEMK